MTRVIAPLDFSECSFVGVDAARRHAELIGTSVVLVHAWDRGAMTLYAPYLRGVQAENISMMNEVEATMRARLDEVIATRFEGFEAVEARVLHDSSAARAVADFAAPDDVIVVATHGRTGVSRILVGSVTEKIVRLAPCPVLVTPTRG